jgi:hypothetical protein
MVALALLAVDSLMAQSPPTALPPIETAVSDERGRIVVNGTPFFPILLYDVPTDAESLKRIHDHGFNMVTVSRTDEAAVAREAGMYSAAHGRKIDRFDSILFGIGMDSPVLNLKPPLLDNLKADLEKVRQAFPNRPVMHAIGYWLDEPAGVIANTLPPSEKYEAVVQAIDVSAPYLYPVPYQPIRSVGEAVGRASAASQGKKPLVPILQIFTWTAQDRYPTAAELKCMVYLSLIHGARGIGFYSYKHVTGKKEVTFEQDQPEIWTSLKDVNTELTQIGPFLLDAAPDASVTLKEGGQGAEISAVTRAGSRLILLANPTDAAREVTLQFAFTKDGVLKPVGRGLGVAIKGGVAKVKLEANGAAAFQN